jgi:two-component system, NtrC family, sensor histidine kinase PilS
MAEPQEAHSWFGPSILEPGIERVDQPNEMERLWRGCMTARFSIALVLLALQIVVFALSPSHNRWLIVICSVYAAATLAVRVFFKQRQLGRTFDPRWLAIIGVDVSVFTALQFMQGGSVNYSPLFGLPVLVAAVLGSMPLAMGAAASVTLILLGNAAWMGLQTQGDLAAQLTQAALTGVGCFAIALLANQITTRLANEELRSRRSQLAARVQRQVNELVIESLTDGILVVDPNGLVRAANPAARQLLGSDRALRAPAFDLTAEVGWRPLTEMTRVSFARKSPQQAEVTIRHSGQGPRRILARTRLTPTPGGNAESLCVIFLQDQRETEARMRTEKLASMGRMSAAMAHEIRNPLAAIVQANALLEEDIADPKQRQLTQIVQQNAKRLEKIVEDILNLARVKSQGAQSASPGVLLNGAVARVCRDWSQQAACQHLLKLQSPSTDVMVMFEPEHLRRVLVNLLDNARRYASDKAEAIVVSIRVISTDQAVLSVWSDGAPMDQSIERNLFEPFFSSESRSSGLGLYICRELCDGHDASIAYQRARRLVRGTELEGNDFFVTLRVAQKQPAPSLASEKIDIDI